MKFGCIHQDCIEKLKEKHVPRLAGTEEEIVYLIMSRSITLPSLVQMFSKF